MNKILEQTLLGDFNETIKNAKLGDVISMAADIRDSLTSNTTRPELRESAMNALVLAESRIMALSGESPTNNSKTTAQGLLGDHTDLSADNFSQERQEAIELANSLEEEGKTEQAANLRRAIVQSDVNRDSFEKRFESAHKKREEFIAAEEGARREAQVESERKCQERNEQSLKRITGNHWS
ncbi:MAG: hypothetical protein P1R74_00755 [Sedimenticola sp.]|nr:hypothetical protein [Sedimenticola sp.]